MRAARSLGHCSGPDLATLRNTALTKPLNIACFLSMAASVTASFTTPWASPPVDNSNVARRRIFIILRGGFFCKNADKIRSARSTPRRHSVASRCARARSGGDSDRNLGPKVRSDKSFAFSITSVINVTAIIRAMSGFAM